MSKTDYSEYLTGDEIERVEKDPVLTINDVVNHRREADAE